MSEPWPKRGGPAQHTARYGDHVSRIAAMYGFRSYDPLWTHPDNAALRQKRQTPHIIAVGDVVHVPEMAVREVARGTEQRHRFTVQLHPLVVRFAFQLWGGKPLDKAPSAVVLDGSPAEFRAGSGSIEVPVTPVTDSCIVKWSDREVAARVGFLQPKDVVAGYRQRLNNLGYGAGDSDDPADVRLRSAIEEFQCDEGLTVDGKCGPGTQARLVKVHGC
jgi:N-acetylmuramoyl-L-alanine amidase